MYIAKREVRYAAVFLSLDERNKIYWDLFKFVAGYASIIMYKNIMSETIEQWDHISW